jgi:predicted CDP-diglyceride synthetase/phosphatidate cytidylyltransferase
LGFFAFAETPLAGTVHPLVLGLLVAVVGALSGLMLAAVRRDLGVAEPTAARLLDRTHVLILAAPVVYCYIHFFCGIGVERPERIFTGG